MSQKRRTKIVCTMGPVLFEHNLIEKLMLAGMDVARFNFSHSTHEEHLARFQEVCRIRDRLGLPVATMLDTRGPEIRTGDFENGKVLLETGQTFTLTTQELLGNQEICSITYKNLPKDLKPGDAVLIDDGLVGMRVDNITETDILCTVLNSGYVSNHKGINVPGVHLSMPFISERDRSDILFGIETGFDFIAASFTRSAEDILAIRRILEEQNQPQIRITGGLPAVTQIDAQFYRKDPEDQEWYLLGTDFAVYDGDTDGVFTASFDGGWYSIDDVPVALRVSSETDSQVNLNIPVLVSWEEDATFGNMRAVFHYNTPLNEQDQSDLDFRGWFEVLGVSLDSSEMAGMPTRTHISFTDLMEQDATMSMLGLLCDQEYDWSQAINFGDVKIQPIMSIGAMPLGEGDYAVSFEIHDVFGKKRETQLIPIHFDGVDTINIPKQ